MNSLQEIISDYQNTNHFSGQILIAKENMIIFRHETGYADINTKKAFAKDQIFPIASVTKQFLAVAILILVENKKIELDQPIISYLASNHNIWCGDTPEWAYKITIHQLLTNSSGLVNYVMEAIFDSKSWSELDNANEHNIVEQIISKVKHFQLVFEPGTDFGYCNTNYLLLGVIVSQVLGENLSVWFKNNIFDVFGMNSTSWPSIADELGYIRNIYADNNLSKRYVANYHNVISKPRQVFSHGFNVICGGAGCMFSSARDLIIWNNILFNGKLITKESLAKMVTIHQKNSESYLGDVKYGYGIMIDNIDDIVIYRHPGHFEGIRAQLSYDPSNKISVAMLSNIGPSYDQDFTQVQIQDQEQMDMITSLHKEVIKFII